MPRLPNQCKEHVIIVKDECTYTLNDSYTGDSTPNISVTMATNLIIFEMTNFQYCPCVGQPLAEVWSSWLPAWHLAFGIWPLIPIAQVAYWTMW